MTETLRVFASRDATLLRPLLAQDAARAAYLLGDLDEPYFSQSRWFVAAWRERPVAIVLSFEGLSEPALLSHGAPDGVAAIFRELGDTFMPRCWAKIPLAHRESFAESFAIVREDPLWTMEVSQGDFRADAADPAVVPLGVEHVPQIAAMYTGEHEYFFEPAQVASGVYVGAYAGERLAAVAGTHVFAPREQVAVLGNIVTAPEYRGRGLGGAVTSRLVEELHRRGCRTVALQVFATNRPAIALYRRLGFAFRDVVLQARCERR